MRCWTVGSPVAIFKLRTSKQWPVFPAPLSVTYSGFTVHRLRPQTQLDGSRTSCLWDTQNISVWHLETAFVRHLEIVFAERQRLWDTPHCVGTSLKSEFKLKRWQKLRRPSHFVIRQLSETAPMEERRSARTCETATSTRKPTHPSINQHIHSDLLIDRFWWMETILCCGTVSFSVEMHVSKSTVEFSVDVEVSQWMWRFLSRSDGVLSEKDEFAL